MVIDLSDGRLSISYDEEDTTHTSTFSFQRSFTRSWTLPKNVDIEKVDAQYADGVLSITVPKSEPNIPPKRRVAIA